MLQETVNSIVNVWLWKPPFSWVTKAGKGRLLDVVDLQHLQVWPDPWSIWTQTWTGSLNYYFTVTWKLKQNTVKLSGGCLSKASVSLFAVLIVPAKLVPSNFGMSIRLGPVAPLSHHLCLLLQQGICELLCLPRLLLFLLLLLICFPRLPLALCNLGFQLLFLGWFQFFTLLFLTTSWLSCLL